MSDTYPHEDLITNNGINVADLKEGTRKLIEKFKTETDLDKKDALDEKIYGQIDDFMEDKKQAEKTAAVKAKVTAHKEDKKKKATDVSAAATAGATAPVTTSAPAKVEEADDDVTRIFLGY